MESQAIAAILRYSTVFARLAVGFVFISHIADRLGFWGPPGASNVAWGNLEIFYNNVRALNPYLPDVLIPVVGWIVNVAELTLGVLLIAGFKTRWAGFLTGLLLLAIAVANAVVFGIKVPLNYSIFSAAAAAFLIASHHEFPLSIDNMQRSKRFRTDMAPFLAIIFLLVLSGCAGDQDSAAQQQTLPTCDLVGAWEPIALRFTDPDGTVRDVEISDSPGIKILSESRWVYVEEGAGDQGPTTGGGGTYRVEGNTYTETVEYHGATSFVGEEIAFDCRTEDGRWYQDGELPDGTYLEEVYRRLD